MVLQEISIDDPNAVAETLRVFQSDNPVVMIELPCVYGLIAPSSSRGVAVLDYAKCRLPDKTYGSIPGNFERFVSMALKSSLPSPFTNGILPDIFVSSLFIRLHIASESTSTPAIRKGTHQALFLCEAPLRNFFHLLENAQNKPADYSLFPGLNYTGTLCTSANISGDSKGSITDYKVAVAFAKERSISLLLRGDGVLDNIGSYPILSFEKNMVRVERSGPGIIDLLAGLPDCLQRLW